MIEKTSLFSEKSNKEIRYDVEMNKRHLLVKNRLWIEIFGFGGAFFPAKFCYKPQTVVGGRCLWKTAGNYYNFPLQFCRE